MSLNKTPVVRTPETLPPIFSDKGLQIARQSVEIESHAKVLILGDIHENIMSRLEHHLTPEGLRNFILPEGHLTTPHEIAIKVKQLQNIAGVISSALSEGCEKWGMGS